MPQRAGETNSVLPPLPQRKAALGWPCAGAGFGGRADAWPTAQAKAVQSGVETMRQVQSLPSSFSRTKFACILGG